MANNVWEYKIEPGTTLKDVMPSELVSSSYDTTKAYRLRDEIVEIEHCGLWEQDEYQSWPGKHKNVHFWVELKNGYLVGWNENPARGWSFPVIKNPNNITS